MAGIIEDTMADWDKIGSMGDIDDRRGSPGGMALGGGATIIGLVLYVALNYFGIQVDPTTLNQVLDTVGGNTTSQTSEPLQDGYGQFAGRVLGSANEYWKGAMPSYKEPQLVLFRGATRSACGIATAQVGPHYCPLDQTIYLDETFFDTLVQLGGSNGDVAQAYVIAHETGHHIQNLDGTLERVQRDPAYSRTGENSLSVRLELQADCYAGLWAYSLNDREVFGPGEISEAIMAAEAVGDDRIQSSTQGSINPETWTHGSAEDRVNAFNKGYESGQPGVCKL